MHASFFQLTSPWPLPWPSALTLIRQFHIRCLVCTCVCIYVQIYVSSFSLLLYSQIRRFTFLLIMNTVQCYHFSAAQPVTFFTVPQSRLHLLHQLLHSHIHMYDCVPVRLLQIFDLLFCFFCCTYLQCFDFCHSTYLNVIDSVIVDDFFVFVLVFC